MAWLYVPGSEGWNSDSALPSEIATEPWATSSGKPSPRPLSWRGWKTRPWIARLSGTISQPSMASACADAWTSCLRASRASRTASPVRRKVTLTNELCGRTSSESSTSPSQLSFSSRTSPRSESTSSPSGDDFETWVSSGLRHSYRPPQSPARRISESDSLPLLPTPSASTYGSNKGGAAGRTGPAWPGLEQMVRSIPTPLASDSRGSPGSGKRKSEVTQWIQRLPSPTAGDSKASGAAGYSTASGRHSGTTLTDAVTGAASEGRSGTLNPRLSEWLQGLPAGWTSSAPLEMSALRQWSTRAHSSLWRADSREAGE